MSASLDRRWCVVPIEVNHGSRSLAEFDGPDVHRDGASDACRIAARAVGATKVYGKGESEVRAIDGIDIEFAHGAFTAIMGPSGSGKSTLMQCMAGLDRLTSGETWIGDVELTRLSERELTKVRRDRVGFIFQAFNLVPTLTALENIRLPLDIAGREPEGDWMDQVIDALHLRPRLKHRPTALSGWTAAARRRGSVPSYRARRSSSQTSRPASWIRNPRWSSWISCDTPLTTSARPS